MAFSLKDRGQKFPNTYVASYILININYFYIKHDRNNNKKITIMQNYKFLDFFIYKKNL